MRVKDISDDVFELVLKRERIQFMPGDCMLLYNFEREVSPYFIASGIQEPTLRFLINKKKSAFVDYLYGLRHGDMVRCDPKPKSVMPNLINAKDEILIAESYGISPILSYLSSYPNKRNIQIYYTGNVNREWLNVHHVLINKLDDLKLSKKSNIYMFTSQNTYNYIISNKRVNFKRVESYILS